MPETRTAGQITDDYINATQEQWDIYIGALGKLWSDMKQTTNLPSKGVDNFSAKAKPFWTRFKTKTEKEFTAYKEALQNLEC
mgnify:CR=1 FL=1